MRRLFSSISEATARRLAVAAFAFVLAGHAVAIAVAMVLGGAARTAELSEIFFLLLVMTFPVSGFVILRRQPRNTIGWVLVGIGVASALGSLLDAYVAYGLAHPGSLPFPLHVAAVASGWWAPVIVPIVTFLILLFPDGRLPSRRWRPVAWLAGASTVVAMTGITLSPGTLELAGAPGVRNPFGTGVVGAIGSVLLVSLALIPISVVLSAVALILRYRRSTGQQRLQMKWLTTAAGFSAILYATAMIASLGRVWGEGRDPTWLSVLQSVWVVSLALIPVSVGIAVLRYRLYDIDVVINRALVYGALAAFITAVYVAIVVGVGAALGTVGRPNVALSILATAVVAVAFGPVKERVQRLANRVVFGQRATPYEVLSSLASNVAGKHALDELLPKMAQALAEGTGATRTEVWLRVGDELRLEGSWPAEGPSTRAVDDVPAGDDRTHVVAVSHDGEALGWIVVRKDAGDPLTGIESRLVNEVAAQAGLVLRNVRLIEDLRASRQRLVAAQDAERRKLERNIHDGAQQRLVALAVRFNLVRRLVGDGDGDGVGPAVEALGQQTQVALENLRDLARGIYPPLLADKGLVAALEAQARKVAIPVTVEADGVARYPQAIEAAIYFCCLEALQNVVKHADASSAVVRLESSTERVSFEVRDDGRGFDLHTTPLGSGLTNIGDRLAALGGTLDVRSVVGAGTTVAGTLPVAVREALPA